MKPAVRQLLMGGGLRERKFLRVATFGDSTADAKLYGPSGSLDQSLADLELTGATVLRNFPTGKWMLSRYYPAAQLELNGGIGGQTTTQMLARTSDVAGATRRSIEDVVSASPNLIIARCGSVNDISGFTAATPQASVDAVFTRHVEIVERLAAGGAYVIDEGIAGFDASGGVAPAAPDLAFIRATLGALNNRYAAAWSGRKRIKFLSPVGVTCDASGAFLTNCTTAADGSHLTDFGQDRVAQAERTLLTSWIGPSGPTPFDGNSIAASTTSFNSTTVLAFGTVPSGDISWGPANGTRQNATIEVINGARFATCELLGTGASPALSFVINLVPLLITPALVAPGDVISIELDFYMDALVGTLAAVPFSARVQFGISGTDRVIYDQTPGVSTPAASLTSLAGHLSFGKVKIPAAAASLTSANTIAFINVTGATGSTTRMKVGNLRIVKH